MDICTIPPKKEKVVMKDSDIKKCKIVPNKYKSIPDILLNNKRIEKETVMELNKREIARAMSLGDVFLIGENDSETLLTPDNYYVAIEEDNSTVTDPEKPGDNAGGDTGTTDDNTDTESSVNVESKSVRNQQSDQVVFTLDSNKSTNNSSQSVTNSNNNIPNSVTTEIK